MFSNNFPKLKLRSRLFSISLWIGVFAAKYSESYFFLILSLKDPIQILSTIELNCDNGHFLCRFQPKITLILFYLTDLILFFLDTYLWYVICNCLFSVGLSFSLGVSILPLGKIFFSITRSDFNQDILWRFHRVDIGDITNMEQHYHFHVQGACSLG